jgi:hypothetical protein
MRTLLIRFAMSVADTAEFDFQMNVSPGSLAFHQQKYSCRIARNER